MSVTQQLIDDIVAAGGVLRVPRRGWYDRDGVDYEQRARIAEQHGKVPSGKWLTIERHREEVELRLEDAPAKFAEATAELVPVVVPDNVARYHPAAARFRDRKSDHRVSQSSLRRAVRIVHAIAIEATRRRWKARPERDGVRIEPPGISVAISIKERGVHRRGRWEEEVKRYRRYTPIFASERPLASGPYDHGATGELELEIAVTPSGGFEGRQSRWRDRQSWVLEDRLPYQTTLQRGCRCQRRVKTDPPPPVEK